MSEQGDRKRTLDERLDAMAETLELQISLEAEARKRQDAAMAEHEQQMAALRAGQAKTDSVLRRAIRLAVREARNERRRRQELDQRFTESRQELDQRWRDLADDADRRHRELEELLRKFLERGGNGQN
jgi:multidrug resistance efflux pump